MPNFLNNEHFLPSDAHTYACVLGSKKYLFFGKFGMLCFLEIPVLRSPFCLITEKLREKIGKQSIIENFQKCRFFQQEIS